MKSQVIDVLLVHLLNWYPEDRLIEDVFAPIGVSYIAASLEARGYKTRIKVLRCPDDPRDVQSFLEDVRPRVVGISATGNEIQVLKRLSEIVKMVFPSIPIVAGGYCSLEGELIFHDSAIDVLVLGEGEETMCELVPRLLQRRTLSSVKGIIFRGGDGRIRKTDSRPAIQNLDELPVPIYAHIPGSTSLVRVYASRGCPYLCGFCEIKDFYAHARRIRYHSADYVKELIKGLVARCSGKVEHVYFNDDEFLLDPNHLTQMAGVARDLGFKICFQTRTRDVLNYWKVIEANRDIIHQIHMGVESFSQSQLDRWKKQVAKEVNLEALQVLADLEVSYYPYIILTDAYTTPGELTETCRGLLMMPACPYAIRIRNEVTHPSVSPIEKGIHLNRMKTFHGLIERSCQTAYLDGVWNFLAATKSEADLLSNLCLYAQSTRTQADAHALSGHDRLRHILRRRISLLPKVAQEATESVDEGHMTGRVMERAEDFIREARESRIAYMLENLFWVKGTREDAAAGFGSRTA